MAPSRQGQILLADKNYFRREFEASIADGGIQVLNRARKGEPCGSSPKFDSWPVSRIGQSDIAGVALPPGGLSADTGRDREDVH